MPSPRSNSQTPPAAGEAAHTPTPYSVETDGEFSGLCIVSEFGRVAQICTLAEIDPEAEKTAAFIVRACNSHAALVAALDKLLAFHEENPPAMSDNERHTTYCLRGIEAEEQARSALTAAKA